MALKPMRFPYFRLNTNKPVWPLGGRLDRPKPIISVSLTGPGGTAARDSLLDTGADDTVFPERVAAAIGVDLTNAPIGEAKSAAGVVVPVRYAFVTLRVTDGHESRTRSAWVGFAPPPFKGPLLGFAGFLQFFGAYFDGEREEVELTVNGLYPGI